MPKAKVSKTRVKRTVAVKAAAGLSKLERAKRAVEALTPGEFSRLLKWLNIEEDDAWDRQMKADAAAGKFDKLIQEADADYRAGRCKEWP